MPPSLETQITLSLQEGLAVQQAIFTRLPGPMGSAAQMMLDTLRSGHKLLLFGNGGSAADAQHIAAEFVGRFEKERQAWPAVALTTDASILTGLGNDYSVEIIFARQIEALGQPGDLAVAISTSGKSPNVLAGARAARARGLRVIGVTGEGGEALAALCDLALCVPSRRTCRIQEGYLTILHILCEVVEAGLSEAG